MVAGQNGTDGVFVRPYVEQGTGQGPDSVITLPHLMVEGFVTELLPIWILAIHMNVRVCILNDTIYFGVFGYL